MQNSSDLVSGVGLILACVVAGMMVMAAGQLFVAVREIAINSRKDPTQGETYETLSSAGKVYKGLGLLVIVGGLVAGIIQITAKAM